METNIKLGPAGIGPMKDVEETFKKYNELGIRVAEIPFTYGVYIKDKGDMRAVKKAAEKFGVQLSIHAPYWINLNSKEALKVKQSKERILKCCEVGHKLGAEIVVFHAGFYCGMEEEPTYYNIRSVILELEEEIKKNKWGVKLAPETMGKVNVFGSVEQIAQLVSDTGCSFCLDFAHILAREKKIDYDKIKKLFGKYKKWHCHFSGIEYGEKGERRHIKTPVEGWKGLLKNLPVDKDIVIINEGPNPVEDVVEGLGVLGN